MEKEKSTTRKQKRKSAIVDTEIPGNWNLKNMIDFPRKERMIKTAQRLIVCIHKVAMKHGYQPKNIQKTNELYGL